MIKYDVIHRKICEFFDKYPSIKKIFLFVYKYMAYLISLLYLILIVICIRDKNIAPYDFIRAHQLFEAEPLTNSFIAAKIILTPLVSFIVVSVIRKCIDRKRPYIKYSYIPMVNKTKKGESMPSRHVFSITIIAMCWLYIFPVMGIIMLILSYFMAACRVIAGVHYISDVIVGFIAAVLCGIVGLWIL